MSRARDLADSADKDITGTLTVDDITASGTIAANSYTGDGSSLTGINTDLVSDTTPQLGGDLQSNGNNIVFADNDKAVFGAGSDLQIYHDAGNSRIVDAGTGNLNIQADNNINILNNAGTEFKAQFITDGAVNLFYDNSKKFETTATGVDVTGTVTADGLTVDGTTNLNNAVNVQSTSGFARIEIGGPSGGYIDLKNPFSDDYDGRLIWDGSNLILTTSAASGGSVALQDGGSTKLTTTATGVNVTGNITVSGTVDGRDIATDGSKLDGIEAGATANQTASEILTAIKTVDGSGSGLDADTVDGIQGSSLMRLDASGTVPEGVKHQYECYGNIATASANQSSLEIFNSGAGTDAFLTFHVGGDIAAYFGLDGGINDLAYGGWSNGAVSHRVWHAGNDGAGSGLDADNLDGRTWSATRNAANTLVTRDGTGYTQLGWINTTSGDTSSTLSRVYVNTGDNYIRQCTLTHLKNQMGVAPARSQSGAWVNHSNTAAIRDDYNITSVTDLGVGQFRPNVTDAFVAVDYSITTNSTWNTGVTAVTNVTVNGDSGGVPTTSNWRVYCYITANNTVFDPTYVFHTAHGDI